MSKQDNETSFEESLSTLESIVERLEAGNLDLNDSLDEFQRGIEAYKVCSKLLNEVEGRVDLIVEENTEVLKEVEFKDL